MQRELQQLCSSVNTLITASVESLVQRLLDYSSRPLPDFHKFNALAMLETLYNMAHDKRHEKDQYYRLAYQTIRERTDLPPGQFRKLIATPRWR